MNSIKSMFFTIGFIIGMVSGAFTTFMVVNHQISDGILNIKGYIDKCENMKYRIDWFVAEDDNKVIPMVILGYCSDGSVNITPRIEIGGKGTENKNGPSL